MAAGAEAQAHELFGAAEAPPYKVAGAKAPALKQSVLAAETGE